MSSTTSYQPDVQSTTHEQLEEDAVAGVEASNTLIAEWMSEMRFPSDRDATSSIATVSDATATVPVPEVGGEPGRTPAQLHDYLRQVAEQELRDATGSDAGKGDTGPGDPGAGTDPRAGVDARVGTDPTSGAEPRIGTYRRADADIRAGADPVPRAGTDARLSDSSKAFTDLELTHYLRRVIDKYGSNGQITCEQIRDTLINNPQMPANELAALLSLHWYGLAKNTSTLTAQDISTLSNALQARAAGRATPEQSKIAEEVSLMNWYYARVANRTDTTKLYANPDDPLASIIPQAVTQPYGVGNCEFVASLAAMAQVSPEQLQKMIKDNGDGTYTVTFPGKEPITVKAPTRGEMLVYGLDSQNGIWAAVLMKAHGQYYRPDAPRNMEGVNGSHFHSGLKLLTGGSVNTDDNFFTRYSTMNERLAAAFRERRVVTAGISNEFWSLFGLSDNLEDNTGLPAGHEYSVLAFTPNNDNPQEAQITLRNPYGTVPWKDKPPEGITDLGDGTFKMSLYYFNKYFSDLTYAESTRS